MTVNIDIERLSISLHGLSAQLIDEAMQGLDKELSRRLGLQTLGQKLSTGLSTSQIDQISLGAIHIGNSFDSASLRGLIAERLLEVIEVQLPTPSSSAEDY